MEAKPHLVLLVSLLVVSVHLVSCARNFVVVWDADDIHKENRDTGSNGEVITLDDKDEKKGPFGFMDPQGPILEWDEFGDTEEPMEYVVDPGSWSHVLEHENRGEHPNEYAAAVRKMVEGLSNGELSVLNEAIRGLQSVAENGNVHAESTLAFLYASGSGVQQSDAKAFLYHHFAAHGGNLQSKMALAYSYSRQQMYEEAVVLYSELAAVAMASFISSKDTPLTEPVRLNEGFEESRESLKKFRGEDDDDFQFLEYQAHKGYPEAMYRLGVFYYFGLRGVRRDHGKALTWLLKAVDKSDSRSMDLLGEIYARGYGVERNYSQAYEWFLQAASQNHYSAFNGIGYLYVKGRGVAEGKNLTKAKEYFRKAAEAGDSHGHYNMGILYLKGLGVKKDLKVACKHFMTAANKGHPKAFYQLAKMQQRGIPGLKRDPATAAALFKIVAERGPWGSLMKWALECYLKGQTAKALLLYSRAAELGYEVGQSNAAWILEKYHNEGICLGQSGVCTDAERHRRAHILWSYSSEQGNEHAALLIGDAYYYGRGAEKNLDRAAEAYRKAQLQQNSQAMFNLGYMYEHGLGLPKDFHLAKRYYDQALDTEPAAMLPVTFALIGLYLRQKYAGSFIGRWADEILKAKLDFEESFNLFRVNYDNMTLMTLFACLLTVLYLRQRQRRMHYGQYVDSSPS
ncbi:ERAD-associated E3 ubiquitin-protein ligase component HRD3A isoform X2 [Physcomitrium patens]|uniref:Uncharacterized protein n=3 Tax=Physcomitrium patens TaxID=3218 RepID=A0A2K1IYB9_PHYPA|nr:hypothetical protein PHYPA_024084 [Physcomitrium patens]